MGKDCRSWRWSANSRRVADRGFDLVRVLPANACANGHADVSNLLHRDQMIAIRAPYLEIAVLVLGMAILIFETFAARIDKKIFAYAGIIGLVAVLIASFFLSPESSAQQANGFWNFYTADPLSIFFKRFTLVTTIVVLVMMIDYAPVLGSVAGHASSNLGEFFSLPLLTCAGLMYLVSAIDFI